MQVLKSRVNVRLRRLSTDRTVEECSVVANGGGAGLDPTAETHWKKGLVNGCDARDSLLIGPVYSCIVHDRRNCLHSQFVPDICK
jgi:hypothetical protein